MAEDGEDVPGATVEVEIREVAHPPAAGGEPVVPFPVVPGPLAIQMRTAVVLGPYPPVPPAHVKEVADAAEAVLHRHLGFRTGKPAIDDEQAKLALLTALGARIRQRKKLTYLAHSG